MQNNDEIRLDLSGESLTGEQVQERIEEFVELRAVQIAQEAEARVLQQAQIAKDDVVLQNRGHHTLTSEEKKFYERLDGLVRDGFSQGVTNVPLPQTIVERVFEDLTASHPLLEIVEFVPTPARVELVYNADGVKMAQWGKLDDKITKELSTGFKVMNLSAGKLSAFLPVSSSVLDLGPEWLDEYVRTVLGEAIAEGLEEGIIKGNGKEQPVGMIKDLAQATDPESGYKDKETVTISALDPENYAKILGTLTKHPAESGEARTRDVAEVVMIVNPATYLTKIYPTVVTKNANGTYVEAFPYPTRVIKSAAVPADKAIFGINQKYFFGLCSDRGGKIDASDHVKFLDDQRVYKVKLYGNGIAKDNNAFVYADIAGLKPTYPTVNTVTQAAVANVGG